MSRIKTKAHHVHNTLPVIDPPREPVIWRKNTKITGGIVVFIAIALSIIAGFAISVWL